MCGSFGSWRMLAAIRPNLGNEHVMLYVFNYLGIAYYIFRWPPSKQPQWPQKSNLTKDLKSATSITPVYMCMLPVTAIFVASEAMATSK